MVHENKSTVSTPIGVLIGLALSLFVAALDATIVSTAMPKIAAGLGGYDHYAWPFTAYLLTSTLATLLCGGLAACCGHKRVFTCGILIFGLSSAGCALSASLEILTLWRALQGIGGGLIEAGVFIAVADLFEPRIRGKYMGLITSMYGLASVIGPLAGGIVADFAGWHWIFLLNLPVCVGALLLVIRFLPAHRSFARGTLDVPGALCAAATVVPLALAFSLTGNSFAWWSAPFFGLLGCAACMAVVLIAVERRRSHPIVPVSVFRFRQVSGAFSLAFFAQFALLTAVMFLPRFVQEGQGLTSTESAWTTIPLTLALMAGSTCAGMAFGKTGALRILARIGFVIMGLGAGALCLLNHSTDMMQIACSSSILGFGIGMSMPLSNIAAQTGVPPCDMGKATSLALFFRGMGGTVGSAACGAAAGASFVDGALPVFALCAGAAAISMVACGLLPRLIKRHGTSKGSENAAQGI